MSDLASTSEKDGGLLVGPRKLPDRFTCNGCPALKLEDWTFEEENDGRDSGTSATCTMAGRNIGSYWHSGDSPPDWCPASLSALTKEPVPHV